MHTHTHTFMSFIYIRHKSKCSIFVHVCRHVKKMYSHSLGKFCLLYLCTNKQLQILLQKTPFAVTNTNSDVGAFYRECQSAPQLQAFMEERTLAEQLGDLTKQLETFETNMQHYEDILSSLCQTENNN